MEKDAADGLSYFMVVPEVHKEHLGAIRHWTNLKVAFDVDNIWVKDIDYAQLNSAEIKSIPYKTTYYSREGKLYLVNSRLPERTVPSLLWTPIERALPIQMPSFNHNYFGISEYLSLNLVPAEKEETAAAMITSISTLKNYVETAPAIRLQKISWVLLNNDKVFLLGVPVLPVTGDVFWTRDDMIIPAGYDFDLYALCAHVNELLNPDKDSWVVWNKDNTYFLIEKDDMQPLSVSSFRESMRLFPAT